ncbi:unnamed protein product [Coffea canephora]|uniref:Uncharacterized protein n=1 Tax=Coffea canephora TaxID=49390 RepID=A0A068UJN7_COFCA|nr:unnamed protein product [Coffea canephora]
MLSIITVQVFSRRTPYIKFSLCQTYSIQSIYSCHLQLPSARATERNSTFHQKRCIHRGIRFPRLIRTEEEDHLPRPPCSFRRTSSYRVSQIIHY